MSTQITLRFLDRTTPPHVVTLVVLAGMSALVMNIFVPSLQVMADSFGVEYSVMQRSVSLYLAFNAVLQIFIGPLSDSMGRRPVILWGTAVFILATLGCILATDVVTFLICRTVQSFIVVGMVLSRAIVRDLYPQDEAASVIGYVTMGMAVLPMIAPMVGGVLSEEFGWRSNFWLMGVLGLALLWLSWRDVGETATKSGLTLGQQFREYPELLTSPRFCGYALATALSSGAFFSYVGGGTFVGTEVFGMTPKTVGFFFGVPALGYMAGNYISGRFSMRVGVNRMVLLGTLILIFGMLASVLTFAAGLGTAFTFYGFMCFVGLGNGLTIPNSTAGALSVRPHLAGTASGLAGAIMLAGGGILAEVAGRLLVPGAGPWPLLWMMLLSSIGSLFAILFVMFRARQLEKLDAA